MSECAGARDLCSRNTFCAAVKVAFVNSSAGSGSLFPSPSIATFSRPALPLGVSLSSPVWFRVELAAAPGVATSAIGPHASPTRYTRSAPRRPAALTAASCLLASFTLHLLNNRLQSKRLGSNPGTHLATGVLRKVRAY